MKTNPSLCFAAIAVLAGAVFLSVMTGQGPAGDKLFETQDAKVREGLVDLSIDNPAQTHDIPALSAVVTMAEEPSGMAVQREKHQIKFFEADGGPDDMPVMLIALDEYRGEAGLTKADCAERFLSFRETDGPGQDAGKKTCDWLRSVTTETRGKATAYSDGQRFLLEQEGTILRAELFDPDHKKEFRNLCRTLEIK